MGYNTRRKSLSLTELGIVLPKRSRAQSHPSPPSTIAEGDESDRPSKKCRIMSPPEIIYENKKAQLQQPQQKQLAQLSPPPSPVREGSDGKSNKVDVEGIGDDVVVATIQQLEATGNRPHLVKELAAILACTLHSVEKSANPCALISSRLTAYLNRPWPSISPCPLAKDIAPVHPRRLYFFLTTLPRQPIPESVIEPPQPHHRILSPSPTSASNSASHTDEADEEERYNRARTSLSPEVDLSSPELDQGVEQEPPTPGAPFSGRNSIARSRSQSASQLADLARGRRGGSPQLEHEERDFKMCATALYEQAQMRRRDSRASVKVIKQEDLDIKMEPVDDVDTKAGADQSMDEVKMSIEEPESDEAAAIKNSEAAAALFGTADYLKPSAGMAYLSSPLIQPRAGLGIDTNTTKSAQRDEPMESMVLDTQPKDDVVTMADWDALLSPENVDPEELDGMFDF